MTDDAAQRDPLGALSKWIVTTRHVEDMEQARIIWREQLVLSHLHAWCAPPNGGKTTVAKLAASELSASAYRVLYFQEDAAAGDLPALFEHAQEHGYQLLNSTVADSATEEQVRVLQRLVKAGESLSGVVMFFDTLKKYTDLMSKGGARAFFKLMRGLTQRGATIVLLGHTNKHKGVDGKLVFEGVGDVRSDVDELIYLDSTKDSRGIVTITMRPDKTRAPVREATFEYDPATGTIRQLEHVVDVAAILERERHREEDASLIDLVVVELSGGGLNFMELRNRVMSASGQPRRAVERVIERYMSQDPGHAWALWLETRLRLNNTRHVSLRPKS